MRHWLVKGYVLCIILTAVVWTDLCLAKFDLWCSMAHSEGHSRRKSMGPVNWEGPEPKEKKLKCDASSVWGVRVSPGRFVCLWKPSPL